MAKSTISESVWANLLAVFVVDTNEPEPTIPFREPKANYLSCGR